MIRHIHLLLVLLFAGVVGFAQQTHNEFYLYYASSGLGSNLGSMQPTLRIQGTNLYYTKEQNSFFKERTKENDSLFSCTITPSTIDSIYTLLGPIKDSTRFESNMCIRSGSIHFLSVAKGEDTLNLELMNTFDSTAAEVLRLVQHYLPKEHQLWVVDETPKLIREEKECWEYFRKRWDEAEQNKN